MTYFPHCSPYISCVTDKENLFNNHDIFTCCLFSLLKKKNDNRPAKTLAYDISHKINGGLLRLESFIFFCN